MQIKDFYENLYTEINEKNSWLVHRQLFTKKDIEAEDLKWLKVLEIWVWPNWLIFKLKEKYLENQYFWIDLSDSLLMKMKKLWIEWEKANIWEEKTIFKDNFFDIIIFNEVIEHIFDCQNALDEIYRILKKWWKLFISTHNTFNIFMRIRFFLWIFPSPNLDVSDISMWEHIRMFNYKLLTKLLLRSWFSINNITNRSYFILWKISFYTRFLSSLFSRHLYFICKK